MSGADRAFSCWVSASPAPEVVCCVAEPVGAGLGVWLGVGVGVGVDAGLGVGVGVGVLEDRPEVHVTELPSALRTHCMVEPVLVSVPAPGGAGLSALRPGGLGTTDRTGGADESRA